MGYYYQRLQSEWSMWSINPQVLAAGIGNIYVDDMPQTITQNALFGEASLEFAEGWKATLGLRGYHYEYDQTNTEYGDFTPYGFANLLSGAPTLAGNTAPFNTSSSGSASGVNPKFDLSWKVNPELLLYADGGARLSYGRHRSAIHRIPDQRVGGRLRRPVESGSYPAVRPAAETVSDTKLAGAPYTVNAAVPQCHRPGCAAVQVRYGMELRGG